MLRYGVRKGFTVPLVFNTIVDFDVLPNDEIEINRVILDRLGETVDILPWLSNEQVDTLTFEVRYELPYLDSDPVET